MYKYSDDSRTHLYFKSVNSIQHVLYRGVQTFKDGSLENTKNQVELFFLSTTEIISFYTIFHIKQFIAQQLTSPEPQTRNNPTSPHISIIISHFQTLPSKITSHHPHKTLRSHLQKKHHYTTSQRKESASTGCPAKRVVATAHRTSRAGKSSGRNGLGNNAAPGDGPPPAPERRGIRSTLHIADESDR